MKITSVAVWTVVVPTIPGRVHSPEYVPEAGWDQVPKHIIRVETDTEFYGIGETGRGVPIDDVRQGAQKLFGRDPETITLQNIYAPLADGTEEILEVGRGPAYDAFEMAVCDLIGRVRGIPVHALLGGAVRSRVRADYWMGHQTPEDGKRAVQRALEHGFKGVKIKCRIQEPMYERLKAMRDVAGPDFKVTVDPNERFYTAEQTIALAEQLAPLGNVEVFEDPIPKSDIEGYEKIHEAIPFPLAMHLGNGPGVIRAIQAAGGKGVVDCVNLGGGLFGFVRNAAVAAAAGLPCWHGSGNDLGIADTSFVHAAAAAPNCTMASDFVGSWTREDDLIVEPIPFVDGYVPTPLSPGLGCEIDEDALKRYTTAHEMIRP
jgi:L-alanine-DL-glutamate epimerase-like enolase superfamily enzyme